MYLKPGLIRGVAFVCGDLLRGETTVLQSLCVTLLLERNQLYSHKVHLECHQHFLGEKITMDCLLFKKKKDKYITS